jgi:hypothetical protein
MIVMERALRRRQEREMEEGDILSKEGSRNLKRATRKPNGKRKRKVRGAVDRQVEVQTIDQRPNRERSRSL